MGLKKNVHTTHPAENDVDHYKFWSLSRISFERTVQTKGQFDKTPRARTTIGLEFIGNPVAKDGVAIQFRERHLTGYTLQPPTPSVPEPHRWVRFSNQFTSGMLWNLGDPLLLLLPAGKTFVDGFPKQPEEPLTHYLCYKVINGEIEDREVQLQDQFDDVTGHPEIEGPLFPAFFGVPVEKEGEPIGNADVHLAIYRFQARETPPAPILIRTADQFLPPLPTLITVEIPAMLAVPSHKIDWNVEG